jgi:phosphoribosylanthranilate isomerase
MQGYSGAKPWFLAGGLSVENVTEAVRLSGAPMLDVSSGVESTPGVKDNGLISDFLRAAKAL